MAIGEMLKRHVEQAMMDKRTAMGHLGCRHGAGHGMAFAKPRARPPEERSVLRHPPFARTLLSELHESRIDPAARILLEQTAEGHPPPPVGMTGMSDHLRTRRGGSRGRQISAARLTQ